ncbi:uncharacterized protein LOC123402764 isoform X6 [Hordeum vulgare subsp. vulgare]|uniref:uncharacterized protein LOC123402764 isoform X6 n=1 Tax=Hordeum vulgare subsp. vulgare TaxID=112509 RepID=UPI001D1A5727|nr:uncharacterized protein LOC123402764 isoform X6 [Hordeum vulgare subsp. vulgare]
MVKIQEITGTGRQRWGNLRELFSVTTASTPTVGRRAAVPGQHPVPEEGATAGKEVFRDTDLSSHSEDDDELKHLKRTVRSWV